jgi:mRNA-degrading endonuclease RelE of RelBE toxin-antitoxin system
MYAIEWAIKAIKQTRAFPKQDRETIIHGVEDLANWPKCRNVKALENHRYPYRLRVGRYRVFFTVKNTVRIVTVEEVRKRDERTY